MAKEKEQTLMHEQTGLSEHEVRVEKARKLRTLGIEPWPSSRPVSVTTQEVLKEFVDGQEDQDAKVYTIAGRVVALRSHGKTTFAKIEDRQGTLQLYFKQDDLSAELFSLLKDFIDVGDLLWVQGTSFKTKTGEITLKVNDFILLAKCLHPLPEKFIFLTYLNLLVIPIYQALI